MTPAALLLPDVLTALQMSRRTFERLRRTGKLPIVELPRLGRKLRFSPASVAAYVANETPTRRRVAT